MDNPEIATLSSSPSEGNDNGPDDPRYPYSDRTAPVKQRPSDGTTAAAVEEPEDEE